jgi:HAD superfamily hydrolase (TIGR01549 family)
VTAHRRIRGVLFDVGGPLDTEVIYERLIDQHIREALAAEGIVVSDEQYAEADELAVASFAPNAYQAIIWRLCAYDYDVAVRVYEGLAARSGERHDARGGFELRAGVPEMLDGLRARGLRLGLAANQPADVIERMERAGIARYFDHRGVSGTHGYRKPDVRVFLDACKALRLRPEECIMVGDRIDNDIVPARALGMATIRFITGRHAMQEPRSWDEEPAYDVTDVPSLETVLMLL